MTNPCAVCARPTDATICTRCAADIVDALTGLTRDIADLVAVETRQAAGPLGVRMDGRFGECENPDRDPTFIVIGANLTELRGWEGWAWAPGASLQRDYVANTVGTWARHVAESRGIELPESRGVLAWLIDNIAAIRHDEAAAVIHDELTGLALENERSIFGRAGTDEFYGVCDEPDRGVVAELDAAGRIVVEIYRSDRTCGAQLYGQPDAKTIRCRACGAKYDAEERKATMRAKLPNSLGTLAEVAGALTKLDEPVTVDALSSAVRRGLIPDRGQNAQGHRLVRVGDVQAYLASRQRGKARGGRIAS